MNLIAASKVGKSWGTYELAFCGATGKRLWGTFATVPGCVLIIDNELHEETSAYRMATVCEKLEIDPAEVDDKIFVANLRGQAFDVDGIAAYCRQFQPRQFQIVIIDAFYRILPQGTDENSNAAITAIYNKLDALAAQLDCAIVLVHHSSKGNQSAKAITDVGSGAGSQSRAADTHLILRPHQEEGVVVLEAAVRSWPPVEPLCLKWEFPVWRRNDSFDAMALKTAQPKQTLNQIADRVLSALSDGPQTKNKLRERARVSGANAGDAIELLLERGHIEAVDVPTKRGNRTGFRVAGQHLTTPDNTGQSDIDTGRTALKGAVRCPVSDVR